jgi:hypothetical protein
MTVVVRERGKRGLLQWYKYNQPALYKRIIARLPSEGGLSAFGLVDPATIATPAPPTRSWTDTFQSVLQSVGQAYLTTQQVKAQSQIAKIQLQRASEGKPPLDINPAQYGLAPQVAVGVTDDTKKTVMYVAGGLGLLYVLAQLAKRGR